MTRIPARADTAVDNAITSGIARPSAWGQAITSTVTVLVIAVSMFPSAHQTANVTIPDDTAT